MSNQDKPTEIVGRKARKSPESRIRDAANEITDIVRGEVRPGQVVRPNSPAKAAEREAVSLNEDDRDVTQVLKPSSKGKAKSKTVDNAPAAAEAVDMTDQQRQEETGFFNQNPVVGWLTIVEGPGRGCSLEIGNGMNMVGRDNTNMIAIDFGDKAISRSDHVRLAYDDRSNIYTAMMGTSKNLPRVNGAPIYQPTNLKAGDAISIGDTTMRFTPLCDDTFTW